MAGGGVKGATSSGAGGDGGGDRRRAGHGFRGRFKAARGRGKRSPSPPGRDSDHAPRGGRAPEVGRGGRGSFNGRGRGRNIREGNPVANNGRGGIPVRDDPPRADDRDNGNEEKGQDHVMEDADNLGHGADDSAIPGQLNSSAPGLSNTKPTKEEARIINQAIDMAVEELLIECANKVMAEEDNILGEGMVVSAGIELAPLPSIGALPVQLGGELHEQVMDGPRTSSEEDVGESEVVPLVVAETEALSSSLTMANKGALPPSCFPAGSEAEAVVEESDVGFATAIYATPTKNAAATMGQGSSPGSLGSRSSYSDVVRGSPSPKGGLNPLLGVLEGSGSQLPVVGATRSSPTIPGSPPSRRSAMEEPVEGGVMVLPVKEDKKKLRRSTRSSVTDEHTLTKTERMAARRNLENSEIDRLTVASKTSSKPMVFSNVYGDEEEDNFDAILNHACVTAYLLMSGLSAAIPVTKRIREHDMFTNSVAASISMAFLAFLCLALSAVISGFKLAKKTHI
ncbi:hypothetical protein EJB05_34856, partial [Eragrostis curvula]